MIDNLPELGDLLLEAADQGVALLEGALESLDGLVATSQRLRPFVQESLEVANRVHRPGPLREFCGAKVPLEFLQ